MSPAGSGYPGLDRYLLIWNPLYHSPPHSTSPGLYTALVCPSSRGVPLSLFWRTHGLRQCPCLSFLRSGPPWPQFSWEPLDLRLKSVLMTDCSSQSSFPFSGSLTRAEGLSPLLSGPGSLPLRPGQYEKDSQASPKPFPCYLLKQLSSLPASC